MNAPIQSLSPESSEKSASIKENIYDLFRPRNCGLDVVTPDKAVPSVMRIAWRQAFTAINISAGFKETGPAGGKLEEEVLAIARPVHVAFVSRSGALLS